MDSFKPVLPTCGHTHPYRQLPRDWPIPVDLLFVVVLPSFRHRFFVVLSSRLSSRYTFLVQLNDKGDHIGKYQCPQDKQQLGRHDGMLIVHLVFRIRIVYSSRLTSELEAHPCRSIVWLIRFAKNLTSSIC